MVQKGLENHKVATPSPPLQLLFPSLASSVQTTAPSLELSPPPENCFSYSPLLPLSKLYKHRVSCNMVLPPYISLRAQMFVRPEVCHAQRSLSSPHEGPFVAQRDTMLCNTRKLTPHKFTHIRGPPYEKPDEGRGQTIPQVSFLTRCIKNNTLSEAQIFFLLNSNHQQTLHSPFLVGVSLYLVLTTHSSPGSAHPKCQLYYADQNWSR